MAHSEGVKVSAKTEVRATTAAQALNLPVLDHSVQGAALHVL